MTRAFNDNIRCPKCGHVHTVETDFERWMRNCSLLDSREAGIVRFDLDVLLHRYKLLKDGKGCRNIQCVMFIEVKTHLASPSVSQIDTLHMISQVLRNRKPNRHSTPQRRQVLGAPNKVYSKLLKRDVRILLYGGHLLQLSGRCPATSDYILWDRKEITKDILIDLLLFERDPDHPERKIDHRRRSRAWSRIPVLFDT
jgi:hypothetical protein